MNFAGRMTTDAGLALRRLRESGAGEPGGVPLQQLTPRALAMAAQASPWWRRGSLVISDVRHVCFGA